MLLRLLDRLKADIFIGSDYLKIRLRGGYPEVWQVKRFSGILIEAATKINKSYVKICFNNDQDVELLDSNSYKLENQLMSIIHAPSTPHLYIGNVKLTSAFLPIFDLILNNPEKNIGVSRIRDNAQIICSAEHSRKMNIDGNVATSIRTHEYWLSSHIQELQRKYTQEGGSFFEHTFECSNYKIKYDKTAEWVRMTTKYFLFDDGLGEIYRVGETLDVEDIAKPLNIH